MILLFFFLFPSDSDLFDSLRKFHFNNSEFETQRIDEVKKDDWMSLIPSIGLGYNLQGKPRPTFNYSLQSIFNLRKEKRERERLKHYTRAQGQILFSTDSLALSKLLRKRETMISEIEHVKEIQDLNEQLFKIQEAKFKEKMIFPDEWLRAKKTITEQRRIGERMDLELIELESEILEIAKYF